MFVPMLTPVSALTSTYVSAELPLAGGINLKTLEVSFFYMLNSQIFSEIKK